MNYAIVENGVVVNVVAWDGDESKWKPAEGQLAIKTDVGGIGWNYDPISKELTPPQN